MVEPVALGALALDALLGWPGGLYARIGHPVGWFARLIGACEARWNGVVRTPRARWIAGIFTVLVLVCLVGAVAWGLTLLLRIALGGWAWIGIAVLAWPGLAQRSLDDHVRPVAAALEAGDLPAARSAVAMIVGRDTATLDESDVARAAIESLAESFCDGVVAPFFWLLLGGLPGLWIYKALNTADSMIGHREPRWRMFGWAAARSDDVANLVPARLAGVILCVVGGGGWGTLWRDAGKHASPNAGWPEAAMAGVLGVRLAGPIAYDGVVADKPWIGTGAVAIGAGEIRRALGVYRRGCALLWIVAGGVAWAL
ncbi:adenosylcobinamide-phosphate synthase CbiB [Sphingomonas glacialis]|uniref:adenosylcobinamide-phosphate synthase CbiB n=1 Tax=Sphingomonas glacialis TaxID=658225 RepID=UPI001F4F82A2|nr:adenosylcobinamide-phosphate synthase CbiB [Sphingomonas glacialis]